MIGTVDERKRAEIQRMQEFFRQKAKEGDAGFAIAYALTLVAQGHRKRSSPRGRASARAHAKIAVLSGAVSDEVHRRAFDQEASALGDD